jgi:nitrite reductase/ring-hydroxylating ferredoxin subunit
MTQVKVAAVQMYYQVRARPLRREGRLIALLNVDGRFYALDNRCRHLRGLTQER